MRRFAALVLVLALSPFAGIASAETLGCTREQKGASGWEPPANGIITNASDALKIGYIAWASVNPKARESSESKWERNMKAVLADHVWKVSMKRAADAIGGDLIISISKCDGRVLDIVLTQ